MPTPLKKITRDYFAEYKTAAKTKVLNPDRLHLHENATLTGNSQSLEGKKAIIPVLENLFSLINDVNVHHQYFDHESSCTILNFITLIPEILIKTVIRLIVVDEGVSEIIVYYDTLPWRNLIHRLQSHSAAAYFQKTAGIFQKGDDI